MAATSLAEQLQRLTVPQATVYKEDKKKASLLFDPKEAASKERDTFYEIGISGLNELIALYEGFRIYEDTLYSLSSKDFERAVQSKEANQNLDQNIEKFLIQLSPYLLLQSAHKALEWLVNRYHIHQYNQDAILALILPYHETKIFIRFVQLLDIKTSKRWSWLKPIQKNGIPLTKQVLYNQCKSNIDTLQFIAKNTLKYVQEFGDRAIQLNTVYAFFCSTTIGTINTVNRVSEGIINALLSTLVEALESTIIDFRSSAYVILGFLSTKAKIKEDTLNMFMDKIFTTEFDLSYDAVLLLNLIYSNQTHVTKISETILSDISVDLMHGLCEHLKKVVDHKISIEPLTLAFLSSVLPLIQTDTEEFRRFSYLVEIFIDAVNFKNQHPEKAIKAIIDSYQLKVEGNIADGDESDVELVSDESDFAHQILVWYFGLLKNIETKYPEAFDKVIKKEMSSESKISPGRRKQLSKVLGFKPAVAHKVKGAYLFENLNHVNPELRIEAVKYIAKEFEALKTENIEFVKESLINRLGDDNPEVVNAALEFPTNYLKSVLSETDLTDTFVKIISKGSKKWRPVVKEAIVKFTSLDNLPVNHDTVLALVPYLFPNDEKSAKLTWHILHSSWGKNFGLGKHLKGLNKSFQDNTEVLNQMVFKVLFEDQRLMLDNTLDILKLNKENTLDVSMYLLLKTCSFKNASIEELTDTLNLLLESVENRVIEPSSNGQSFSKDIMPEFIKLARQHKMLFETMEYIFSRIIEDMPIKRISTPWCNVCESSDTILVRRLYEICITGCSIPSYSGNYSKMMQKLLKKCFNTPREKFEFIGNVACGHILYATDPKNVISPELQLRSMKLLTNFISVQEDATWMYESDVVVLMVLFNLNNPIIAIRQCTIDFVQALLSDEHNKNLVYAQLLKELLTHKQELLLDHEQILHIINTVLTKQTPGNKIFKKNCLTKFSAIVSGDTPAHIKASFVKILAVFNNATAFAVIVPSLNKVIEKILKNTDPNNKIILNIYESNLMKSVYGHINETTVSALSQDFVWNSIEIGLKQYTECILEEDQSFTSPCVEILKQIDEDVFKKVPEEKSKELVYLITSAGAFGNNPKISSAASRVMKKIHLKFSDFKPILDAMVKVEDSTQKTKKKKSALSMLSYELTETNQWKLGVALLEYVQSKKKMTVDNSFVQILFQLFKKCLRFEDQSYVEYTKQLILSSLWYFCKKFVDDSDKEQLKSLKSMFDVELVVQCIRGTQNPQTHHHALILMSHAAYMMPEQVLHHTMEIFTFMGSSILRHDDAYSFQIIIKIIETLIPILVKLDKKVEEYTQKELQQLQNRVVPVLRIFADVVLHVPEHRRLPLYKKLIETLGPSQFLWVFLGLLLETHITHFKGDRKDNRKEKRTLADQESPIGRLDFGQSLVLEFPPEIGLDNFIKLIMYIQSLPIQKDKNCMDTDVNPSDIFSVNGHSPVQLRHYKYIIITFMNTCLASSRFIQHCQSADMNTMEGHYKSLIVNILTFIQSISKVTDDKNTYWKVMLHHSYDLLDHTNSLLSPSMFVSVVRGLTKHNLIAVRRKSMELLNSKIQFSPEMFEKVDRNLLYTLLPVLLEVIKTVGEKDEENLPEAVLQELETCQQTALLSLKLLTRMLALENPEPFKPVLETVTDYICNPDISGNVMASFVLCLAELCGNLKAHALTSLRKFMPALIKILKKQRKVDTADVVILSTITTVSKIVESLPLFLSPYLQKLLFEYSILLAKWLKDDQECSKVSAVVSKLLNIKKKIAGSIPPRVLIPVANETHKLLLEKKFYDAIGPVMSVLADSFANVTTADFNALQQDLTAFFLAALQLRSDAVDKDVNPADIDKAEDEVVNALVCLVLKLSETSFRPFYFKIYDWAIRTNVEGHKDRTITFYRLSSAIADKLKGLFVLFAGHFIKNAAELLDACNSSKTEDLYFDSEDKCIALINYIIKTLHIVFLYDSQSFINKDRFETLMQPIVDQLENTVGGITSLKTRATESIIPCISQFAVATADDSLWKLLNYQILLKIRHNDAEIRLTALDCLVSMATQLGSSWLPLLAESVPFLAELLEDGDSRIEAATKEAIRKLEQILGEPLEKYF